MALLGFLKKEDIKEDSYTPKSNVTRGPGGKFVSKKKTTPVEQVKTPTDIKTPPEKKPQHAKVYGPFMAPFSGHEIRKYSLGEKWFYSIEDLMLLLYSDPPFKVWKELKNVEKYKKIVDGKIKQFEEVDCLDEKTAQIVLLDIIKTHGAQFPGSLFRWLSDISAIKYEQVKEEEPSDQAAEQINPSDRA